MTETEYTAKLRAAILAVVMVVSVAVGSVAFGGVAVAEKPVVDINEITVNEDDDVPINDSKPSKRFVNPGDDVEINYTLDPENNNETITSASVVFEAANDNTVVERDVTADSVTERVETVEAPSQEGFYEIRLEATDGNDETNFTSVTAVNINGGFLGVQSQEPTVNVLSPDDSFGSYPVIEGTAFDGAGIQNVTLTIENRTSDMYWNGSNQSWESSEVAFEVASYTAEDNYGETVSWSFDVYSVRDRFDPQDYVITANAYDGLNNTLSDPGDGPPSVDNDADTGPEQIDFELAPEPPQITDIEFLKSGLTDSRSNVTEGSVLGINVTVDPRGTNSSSVGPASVESTDLGIGSVDLDENESYEDGDKIRYQGEVTVDEPTAPGGLVDVTATVDVPAGPVTSTDAIELVRDPDQVGRFSVDADFIGLVEDDASEIDVTLGGIEDATGRAVDVGGSDSLKLRAVGENGVDKVDSGITATFGEVDNPGDVTIDPSELTVGNHSAGSTTIEVVHVDDDGQNEVIGSTTVDLVHEAYALESDQYQPVGTPMAASDVSIDSDVAPSVITWDPTADGGDGAYTTGAVDETAPGEGYYVYTEDSDARIGYTFETDSVSVEDETFEGGSSESQFYLIGATTVLETSTSPISIKEDLKGGESVSVSDSNVTVYRDSKGPSVGPDGSSDLPDFGSSDSVSDTVDQFEAYWIEVDSNEELIRAFQTEPYDPTSR